MMTPKQAREGKRLLLMRLSHEAGMEVEWLFGETAICAIARDETGQVIGLGLALRSRAGTWSVNATTAERAISALSQAA